MKTATIVLLCIVIVLLYLRAKSLWGKLQELKGINRVIDDASSATLKTLYANINYKEGLLVELRARAISDEKTIDSLLKQLEERVKDVEDLRGKVDYQEMIWDRLVGQVAEKDKEIAGLQQACADYRQLAFEASRELDTMIPQLVVRDSAGGGAAFVPNSTDVNFAGLIRAVQKVRSYGG